MVAEKSNFSSNAKHNFDIHWSVWMNIENLMPRIMFFKKQYDILNHFYFVPSFILLGTALGRFSQYLFQIFAVSQPCWLKCHSALKYQNISKILKLYGDTVIVQFPLDQSITGTGTHTATHTHKQIPEISVMFFQNNLHRIVGQDKKRLKTKLI